MEGRQRTSSQTGGARVEKVCKAVPGTVDAVVDLQAKTVTVTGSADPAALKQAITDADYEVVE